MSLIRVSDPEDQISSLEIRSKRLRNIIIIMGIAISLCLVGIVGLLYQTQEIRNINYNTSFSGQFYILGQYNALYDSDTYLIRGEISYDEYFTYRLGYDHPSFSGFSDLLVAKIMADYCISSSVSDFANLIKENVDESTDECIIDGLLTFVQDRGDFDSSLHYVSDGTDDFAKYPIETLCEGGGDCEDLSILFASLVRSLGYSVRICVVPGHVFVAIELNSPPTHSSGTWNIEIDGKHFYTCETTSYGWLIGDLPSDYQGATITTYPVS